MIYDKVRKLAKEQGISIPNLEKECGLSNGSIAKWNTSKPRIDNLKKVADRLGTTIEELIKDE